MYKFDSKDFFVSSLSNSEIWATAIFNEYITMVKIGQDHKCRIKFVEGVSPGYDYSNDEPMPPLTGDFCFIHRVSVDSRGVCSGRVLELKHNLDSKALQTLDTILAIHDSVLEKLRSWELPESTLETITRKDIKVAS